jgi:hypothetical protein
VAGRFWHWYEKANRVVRFFTGPAQIGAGHAEGPDVRTTDHPCPICGAPLSGHHIQRSANQITPTRMICPQ